MRKNIFRGLIAATLGLAMALGVGAGLAINSKATKLEATTANQTASTSITSGSNYLVTAVYDNTRYYLTPGNAALDAGNVVATSINDVSTATLSMCWTFTGSGTSWSISANGFYLANTNTNNGVKTQANSQTWTSSFSGSNLTLTGASSRKLALYQGSNWRCYTSNSGVQSLQIYEFSTGGQQLTKMDAPTISLSGTVVSWQNIEGNNGYSYSITGDGTKNGDLAANTTSLDVSTLSLAYGSYSIAVVTKGNGTTTSNSDPSNAQEFTLAEPSVSGSFNLFSGNLVEGDYILYYNNYALKNVVSSNRFGYSSITPSNNSFTDPAESIVWHLAKDGDTDYWTLYNDAVDKYAGGTGTKNQGALLESITDYARWTVTGTNTYDFENKGRAEGGSDTGNKWLRNNGTNGFACYASGTGGALTLYKKYVPATAIGLNKAVLELSSGEIETLTASLTPSNADDLVSWATSSSSVAAVAAGVVTAREAGSATITAFIDADSDGTFDQGEINATCSITVTEGIPATNIDLNQTSLELLAGQQTTLTATVTPNDSTDAVTWSSSDETTAIVDDGVVTTLKNGIVTITATAGSVHADCELSITSATAAENFIGAKIDRTGVLIAASYKNAIIDDGYGGFWVYASSNVTQSAGTVVNLKGTSTVFNGGLEVAGATLTTVQNSIQTSTATPLSTSEAEGYLEDYLAEPKDPNFFVLTRKVSLRTGVISNSTWTYGEANMKQYISNVSLTDGRMYDVEGYLVNFHKPEDVTYLCMCITDAQPVQIEATGVNITEESIGIAIGSTETLTATLTPDGAVGTVVWSSDDDSIASVDQSGVVTGNAAGTTTITATVNGQSDTCTVRVVGPSNTNFRAATSIAVGDIVYLTCNGTSNQYTGPSTTSTVYGIGAGFTDLPDKEKVALEVVEGSEEGTYGLKLTSGANADKYLYWGTGNSLNVNNSLTVNTSWDITFDGNGNATIKNAADNTRVIWWNVSSPRFACYTDKTDGDAYKYVQLWKNNIKTTSVATVNIQEINSVDTVVLRFGAKVPMAAWSGSISDYGVMLVKQATLTSYGKSSIAEAYKAGKNIADVHRGSGSISYSEGDNYIFNVRVNITDSNYDVVYRAAPYLVINGTYYFLDEMTYSVKTMAAYCLANPGSSALSTEELNSLAGNN